MIPRDVHTLPPVTKPGPFRLLSRAVLFFSAAALSLGSLSCNPEARKKEEQLARPLEERIPDDYEGPIDPEWPPSHPADLEVELKSSALYLQRLAEGGKTEAPDVALLPGDHPGVYAEQGQIGGFDYIEVILGPMTHPDEEMPLVVLLHGRGGRPRIPRGPFHTTKPVRLFIPRGPDKLKNGFQWLATSTNSGDEELLARSLAGRVDQLAPAIEAFGKLNKTVGKPVVMGFSQGGILTYTLATRYPALFSAAFPVAGWLPPSLTPKVKGGEIKYPFIHAIHGGEDTIVPTQKGRETAARLKALGLKVSYTEIGGAQHVVSPEMNILARYYIRSALYPEDYPAWETTTF